MTENVRGKTNYRMVSIPYASQPVYVNFIDRELNSSSDLIEKSLYEDITLTKLIGTVIIKYDGLSLTSTFKSVYGKEIPFVPDFYMGKCSDNERFSAYHSVHEVKDHLARLGEGPWGKQAWVKSRLVEFDRLPLKYEFNGEKVQSLMVRWDNYVGVQPFNTELEKYFSYKMPVTTLLAGFPNHIDFNLACNINFSGRYEVEPMVVDLVPANFAPYGESSHYMNSTSVQAEAFACKFIGEKYWDMSYEKIDVSLDRPVDALFLTYADSKEMNFPSKTSDSQFYFSHVRPKSSPMIFGITEDQNIKVSVFRNPVLNGKMDVTSIKLKNPEKFIRHKFLPVVIPEDTIVKLYVSNFELGQLRSSKPLELDFSPGDYPLKIRSIRLHDESTEEYFNLTVTAEQMEQKMTIDLSKVHKQKHFYLGYHDKSGKLSSPDSVSVKTIEKFSFVSDRTIDLSGFLVPNKLETKRPEELKQFLNPLEAGSIIAEGACVSTEAKPSFHSITIYSSHSDSSDALGALKLRYKKNNSTVNVSYIRQDGFAKEFRPNYFREGCEKSNSVLLLHQVNNVQGEWSDLGQGPWGNSGWIKVAAKPLFNNDLVFEVNGFGYGRLKKKSNDSYVFTPEEYYGSEQDPKPKDVPKSNLVDKHGISVPKIICELGC